MNPLKHIAVASLSVTLMMGCTADIRPDTLLEEQANASAQESKGRRLLEQAAQAHGAQAWRQVDTYSMVLTDSWQGVARMLNPWPDSEVKVRLSYHAGSFDGRATFLSGEHKGTTWGLQAWKAYTQRANKPAVFEPDDDISFILPAIQYLTEFVFRDHSKQVVRYAGPQEVGGVRYERVFVTWNTLEPSTDVDQYVVYIHPKSHRVEKIFYTVRDTMRAATGAIHFEDVRDVNGVKMSFKQSITMGIEDDPEDYAHRIVLKSVALNQPALDVFRANPKLPLGRDSKP